MFYKDPIDELTNIADTVLSKPSALTLMPVDMGPAILRIRDENIKRLRSQHNWIGSIAMINWDVAERAPKSSPEISILSNFDVKAIHLAIRAGLNWWQAVELAYHNLIIALDDPGDLVRIEAQLDTTFSKVADFSSIAHATRDRDGRTFTLYSDENLKSFSQTRSISRVMLEFYSPNGVIQAQQMPKGPSEVISQLWDFSPPRQEAA